MYHYITDFIILICTINGNEKVRKVILGEKKKEDLCVQSEFKLEVIAILNLQLI